MVKKLLFILSSTFILLSNVYAATFDVTVNSKVNGYYFPNWWGVASSGSNANRNLTIRYEDWQLFSQNAQFGYASYGYLYVCATGEFTISSPPTCSTGCFSSNLDIAYVGGNCTVGDSSYGYQNGKTYFIFYGIDSWAWNVEHTLPYYSDIITFHTTESAIRIEFISNTLTDTNYYVDYASNNRINELQQETNNRLNSINSSINNQTSAINNQTSAINNQTSAINNQTNSINNQTNLINDDSLPNTSNFLDDWTDLLLENNTINQILYLPVNVLTNIKSAFNGTCNNYTMPFGLTGGNETLTFNCWTISDYLGSEITGLISGFIGFYMIYYFALFLWKFYDDFTSMKDTLSIILENPDGPLQKGEIE